MHLFVSTHIHTYICVYICTHTPITIHMSVSMHLFVSTYIHIYVCIYVVVSGIDFTLLEDAMYGNIFRGPTNLGQRTVASTGYSPFRNANQ